MSLCSDLSLNLVCFFFSLQELSRPLCKMLCPTAYMPRWSHLYLPSSNTLYFMRKYIQHHPHISMCHRLCTLTVLKSHVSVLLDGRHICMTMLLIPLSVLLVLSLHQRTPVLGITRIPIDCVLQMWADVVTGVGLVASPSHSRGKTGCAEHVIPHCRNFHGQKALHVPHTFLGRFEVHPDILEPFIAFTRDRGMTDEQEIFTTHFSLG